MAHGQSRRTETITGPGLDLAEDDRPVTAGDDVDLAGATSPVPIDHLVAVFRVPLGNELLTARTEGTVVAQL